MFDGWASRSPWSTAARSPTSTSRSEWYVERTASRRRIAAVAGPYDQENSAADRLAGYRDVLPAAPAGLVEKADYTRQGGADAMAVLLDRCPDLDAVFVASDFMASGVLQTLRERGRLVEPRRASPYRDPRREVARARWQACQPPVECARDSS